MAEAWALHWMAFVMNPGLSFRKGKPCNLRARWVILRVGALLHCDYAGMQHKDSALSARVDHAGVIALIRR